MGQSCGKEKETLSGQRGWVSSKGGQGESIATWPRKIGTGCFARKPWEPQKVVKSGERSPTGIENVGF